MATELQDSATVIICWDNKVLLFHRDNIPTIPHPDLWQLPGGGIEEGETPLEGLKRELIEEVSYVPKSIEFLCQVPRKGEATYVYGSFVNEKEAKQFKIGESEGQEVGFFTIKQALKLRLTPELRYYVIKFINEIIKAMREKSFPKFSI